MTPERKRAEAALVTFTGNGKHSSGFVRNDIRDLIVQLMAIAADRDINVPKLNDAALGIYGEQYGVNV